VENEYFHVRVELMNLIEQFDENGIKLSARLADGINNYLIDIDGTICDDIPNEEPERMLTASEFAGAKDSLNKLYEDGHIITFFTSRTEAHKENTIIWLEEHDFKYHNIIFNKPRGGNYIWLDDRDARIIKFKGSFDEL